MTVRRSRISAVLAAVLLTACGGAAVGGIPAGDRVIIEFATQGLGEEGDATNRAVAAFESANPSVQVNILTLSPDANVAYGQLTQRLRSGDPVPDVLTLDVIWPAAFASAGWLAPLDRFHPAAASFTRAELDAGTYLARLYAMPWFTSAEGVYYRTDLVPRAPGSPQQLVQAAQAAMQRDPAIRTGLAFEGDRYEGIVTAFIDFGGRLDLQHVDSAANLQALTFMSDALFANHISPPATTTWHEPNVEQAYLSGSAAFAMNWPYMYSLAEAPKSPIRGLTAWVPFPPAGGAPQAALGGDVLAVNARSAHQDVAWRFIQYLLRDDVQIQRALIAGDPPAVRTAYNATLFDQAPFYRQEQQVIDAAVSRPVDPEYPRISDILQRQINAALTGQMTPAAALAAAQQQVTAIVDARHG